MTKVLRKNTGELGRAGAQILAGWFLELAKTKSHINLALPGGRSVLGLLEAITVPGLISGEVWRKLHFFMVDERLVPIRDPQSNFSVLRQALFDEILGRDLILEAQVHPFHYDAQAKDLGLGAYGEELRRFGGCFDVVVLGVGEDGHVAALFPGHPALEARGLFVSFNDSPKPPAGRMSATRALIAKAQFGLGLCIGEGKKGALKNYVNPTGVEELCPAKILDRLPTAAMLTDIAEEG